MKHIIESTTLVIATVFVLGTVPSAQANECSNATLRGSFGYTTIGSTFSPVAPPLAGPFANVGRYTFDGNGHVYGTQTVNLNGNILRQTLTGTYTVNPDCTGSVTIVFDVPAGLTIHDDFVVDDHGTEFRAIQTDPGEVVTTVGKKQFLDD